MLPCHSPDTPALEAALMLGSTSSLTLRAWGSGRLPLLNRSSSVCAALTGCRQRSLGWGGWMCPRPAEGWRGVGQRHPHVSAGALSSHAVAHGSALMEHEVMQNRLGSTGSDLNWCPSFSASQGWAKGATASLWKSSPDAGLPATSVCATHVECQEE